MIRAVASYLLAALAFVAVAQVFLPLKARAHDIYGGPEWRVPNNPAVSCCDNTDCRPTRAYVGEDGLWRAWTGAKWLTVPREVMLPTDLAKDGRAHLCEKGDWIFCFSPSEPKS